MISKPPLGYVAAVLPSLAVPVRTRFISYQAVSPVFIQLLGGLLVKTNDIL